MTKRESALLDTLQIALSFAEHPDYLTVQVGRYMIPRDVWIDAADQWINDGMRGMVSDRIQVLPDWEWTSEPTRAPRESRG